jgi:hypothetical protein
LVALRGLDTLLVEPADGVTPAPLALIERVIIRQGCHTNPRCAQQGRRARRLAQVNAARVHRGSRAVGDGALEVHYAGGGGAERNRIE